MFVTALLSLTTFSSCALGAEVGDRAVLSTLRKEHPRLIALQSDVARVKQLIATNAEAKALYDELVQSADRLLGERPVEYRLQGPRLLNQSRRCLDRVYTLATVYRLSGDGKYLDRAKQELMAAANFQDWHPQHFLDTAELAHAFAIGYDWLYQDLTDAERRIVREALVQKGLGAGREAYEGTQPWKWWVTARHNWNQVCNGGLGLGALAVADEEPQLAEYILQQALKSLPRAMAEFAPEGGWPEGPGYWHYATRYNVYFIAGLQTALGTDFGLPRSEGFPETGMFPLNFVGPTGDTFNFADAGARWGNAEQLFWMAKQFDKPIYAWHERQRLSRGNALDLWWFDARGNGPKADKLPLDALFKGVNVAFLRSAWEDPDAIFVGFKGGDNKANHSHLDLGTFVLDALGTRWALDLGGDDYNLPAYFGGNRWTYYRLRTEGHNTVVLNGQNQDPKAESPVIAFRSTPARAYAVADLSAAYAAQAKRVWRGVALLDRSRVVVQDEIEADAPVSIVCGLHTRADIEIQGATATLTRDDAHLRMRIVEPREAVFKVLSAQPSAPQAQNEGVSNLAVQLSGPVRAARIVVELMPYRGQPPKRASVLVAPLSQWVKEGS